jgi:HEAT repeat protein
MTMELDEYVKLCVVKIFTKPRRGFLSIRREPEICGTGFWVLPDGHIVTCYHVVAQEGRVPGSVDIEYRGRRQEAIFCPEKSNPKADLAVLQVTDEHLQPDYVLLGQAEVDVEAGAYGYRRGFPEGYSMTGVIRRGELFSSSMGEIYNFETRMPGRSSVTGMSGGPVFDVKQGVVVGVQYAEEKEGASIGYVHPVDKIYENWPELKARNSTTLLAKLRELEMQTSRELVAFDKSKLFPERKADLRLRELLAEAVISQTALWIVRGEAGVGKSTLLLRLIQWCQEKGRQTPLWLDLSYFQRDSEKFNQYLGSAPNEVGSPLQDYARLTRKQLVLFIDALDVILPHTDAIKLVTQLKELSANAIVICTSRPFELERLSDSGLSADVMDLDRLSSEQVRLVFESAGEKYHIRMHELNPKLVEMCQNPFVLNLVIEANRTEALPQASNVTDTLIKERYWRSRIKRVRPETFTGYRFGGMTKSEVGEAKVEVAYAIAGYMLNDQTYRLNAEMIGKLLEGIDLEKIARRDITSPETVKETIYQELNAEGVIRIAGWVSFLHDTFADFAICREILDSDEWRKKADWLLARIDVPFYVPILVHLVLQARDVQRREIENHIYGMMISILDHKGDGKKGMNKAWGATYALRQLVTVWMDRFCEGLHGNYSQEVASSIASVLEDVRHAAVRDALIAGMSHYKYKKRFVDNLGASGDPLAVGPLMDLLAHILKTEEDAELLETIAAALGSIGDDRAEPLLSRLEADDAMPPAARRAARMALYSITRLARYAESFPYSDEETIAELRIWDVRDSKRPSDWKMVKRAAERVAGETGKGKPVSPSVVDALHGALDHEHEDAQLAVVWALSAVASEASVDMLIAKVTDEGTPDTVRKEIVKNLRKIAEVASGSRERVYLAFQRIARDDPNPRIRQVAHEARVGK